jgi:hypothetical protein
MILLFVAGGFLWLGAILAAPPILWGFASLTRLQRETGGVTGG